MNTTPDTGQDAALRADVKARWRDRFRRRDKKVTAKSAVALRSLAPRYDEAQHAGYVTRLTEAVTDPNNRNIALTGRYGSGKSSVLDQFEAQHRATTLRLAISTLAPAEGETGITTTNRIQKELVKQIVYSAPKKVGRNSRFSRIAVPSRAKFFLEAAVAVAALGLGLFVFGRLPELKGLDPGWPAWVRPAAWVTIVVALAAAVTAMRLATHGRFRIGDVKAGGTSVSLTEKAPTYFDQFIDELVHYFDEESKDIVIFEDLDRFENPQIFQELRELNVLLNDTPRRRRKRNGNAATRVLVRLLNRVSEGLPQRLRRRWSRKWSARLLGTGEPLRFVYAVKDSLFEHLGEDSKALAAAGDAAAAETMRANRTKFFDVVIPLVPFISHRNARELLDQALADAGVTGIDKRLVGVVARHATDMRLLRNICNEYVVFAERLLVGDRVAPDLDPSKLFALVTYKNFHLADFELIPRRASALDQLLGFKQELVRSHIANHQARLRVLRSNPEKVRASKAFTPRLADGVRRFAEALLRARGYNPSGMHVTVGSDSFTFDDIASDTFWSAVAEHGQIAVLAPQYNRNSPMDVIDKATIAALFPEGLLVTDWGRIDEEARQAEQRRTEVAIERLRGAGFRELVPLTQYTLSLKPSVVRGAGPTARSEEAETLASRSDGVTVEPTEETKDYTFGQLVDEALGSDLAKDLVKDGFIDQNFALYAAQFYGHFVGVDVATFVVQSVQPNEMLLDYSFTTQGAVKNLLAEVDEDFLTTVAAYNLDVVNHLIETQHPGVQDVVARLVTHDDPARRKFLASYFTSGAHKEALAARLAAHPWREVFTYLTTSADVSDDLRPDLVGAALGSADAHADYDLPAEVTTYVEHNYADMEVFVEDESSTVSATVATMAARAGVIVPRLAAVHATELHRRLTKDNRYTLTADNLRSAIGARPNTSVSLDAVVDHDAVYDYCLSNPAQYLTAAVQDEHTDSTVESEETLGLVIANLTNKDSTGLVDPWTIEDLRQLFAAAAQSSRQTSFAQCAPQFMWPELAAAGLVDPTLANVDAYRAVYKVDEALGSLLTQFGLFADNAEDKVTDTPVQDRIDTAVALLSAPEAALTNEVRVKVVQSLELPEPIAPELITPAPGDLFKRLLEAELVADEAVSFEHFKSAGWSAIGPAIGVSNGIAHFLTPDLIEGMVGHVLNDHGAADKLAGVIIGHHGEFLPPDDDSENASALKALASYAVRKSRVLPAGLVVRIAAAGKTNADDVLHLLKEANPQAEPKHIVRAFALLGTPYDDITTPGAKFRVDERHKDLVLRLKRDGVVDARKATLASYYDVTVPAAQ